MNRIPAPHERIPYGLRFVFVEQLRVETMAELCGSFVPKWISARQDTRSSRQKGGRRMAIEAATAASSRRPGNAAIQMNHRARQLQACDLIGQESFRSSQG